MPTINTQRDTTGPQEAIAAPLPLPKVRKTGYKARAFLPPVSGMGRARVCPLSGASGLYWPGLPPRPRDLSLLADVLAMPAFAPLVKVR